MDVAERVIQFHRRRRVGLLRSIASPDRRVNPTELVVRPLFSDLLPSLDPHPHLFLTGVLSTSILPPPR